MHQNQPLGNNNFLRHHLIKTFKTYFLTKIKAHKLTILLFTLAGIKSLPTKTRRLTNYFG
jgi:hypothetical protein